MTQIHVIITDTIGLRSPISIVAGLSKQPKSLSCDRRLSTRDEPRKAQLETWNSDDSLRKLKVIPILAFEKL